MQEERKLGHNYKPLVSPEYLCNPLEGNTGVTAHSVLHQDPTNRSHKGGTVTRVRNHTEHAKANTSSVSGMNAELE